MKVFEVKLYTDGACSGNPGPGGFGSILIYKNIQKKISQGYRLTTNNRMELLAVIEGLKNLKKKCNIEIFSDSKYITNAINQNWLNNWQNNNWKNAKKQNVKNSDLWKKLIALIEKHNTRFIWVKGHSDNYYNNLCDKMAVNAYSNQNLLEDSGFINDTK